MIVQTCLQKCYKISKKDVSETKLYNNNNSINNTNNNNNNSNTNNNKNNYVIVLRIMQL